VIFGVLLASAPALVEMVSSIDFTDAVAVADAVDALLHWRDDVQQDFCRRPSCYPTTKPGHPAGVNPATFLQRRSSTPR
jgi:hypothetical protein